MKKKIACLLMMLMVGSTGFALVPAGNAAAYNCTTHFLGLKAWYDNLVDSDCKVKTVDEAFTSGSNEERIRKYVWTIVLNCVSMVLGIVGYLAIGLVMWGGYQYIMAQGDPGKVAKGKKTITNSITGLVIVLSASIISSLISGVISDAHSKGDTFFLSIFNEAILWAGIIAGVMVVWGGIQYITSTGNPAGVAKAKSTIMFSLIGLLIVIFAAVIVNTVVGAM